MSGMEWVGTLTTQWRGFVNPAVLHAAQHQRDVDVADGWALGQPVEPPGVPDGRYTLVWDREAKVARLAVRAETVRGAPAEEEAGALSERQRERPDEALGFNRSLGVPVAWLPDYHFRPDGSAGSGWANRVYHVRLREDLAEGRLRRGRGDWLCKPSRRGHGELFSVGDREEEHGTGEESLLSIHPVTCKACLRMSRRWAESPREEG